MLLTEQKVYFTYGNKMKIELNQNEFNYAGTVVEISNLAPVEGLNNLVATRIHGETVLVGKETKIGDTGIFFPAESALSFDYLRNNNLYRHKEFNVNKEVSGYFEDSGRVKAIKFKGIISTGFWAPIDTLNFLGSIDIPDGTSFHKINDVTICYKHKATTKSQGSSYNNPPKPKKAVLFFAEHEDTAHLLRCIKQISKGDFITITTKLHGTSGRTGRLPVFRKLSFIEKIAEFFGANLEYTSYDYVHGSRRVTKSIGDLLPTDKNHFYSKDIWSEAGTKFIGQLYKGETVYYEIVGWDGSKPIQPGYTYRYPQGMYGIYVYRITMTTPDGIVNDLPYYAMAQRCAELGAQPVELIKMGFFEDMYESHDAMEADILQMLDEPSSLDPSAVEEGFVVSVHRGYKHSYYKAKSPKFLAHETKMIDKGEADIEEEQNV